MPYSLIKKAQGDGLNNFNRVALSLKDLQMKYLKITNLYKTGAYDQMIISSIEFINHIIDKISQQIGFKYKDLNEFIERIKEKKLKKKFILYNEIETYITLLNNNSEANSQYKPKFSSSILSIIKKIMDKIKIQAKTNKDNHFSSAYNEFKSNSINIKSPPSVIKYPEKIRTEYQLSLNALTELDDFSNLESFVDELFKLQKENK
ncbi:MAG: hypothetical protein ACFFCM_22355 [Promethearchaeota archaeon]